jgi:transposase
MAPLSDTSLLCSAEKDALIGQLMAQIDTLCGEVAVLSERVKAVEKENATLREELHLPPKTPRNSSTPPSQGHKANSAPGERRKGKGHPGTARALHPNPTRHCKLVATHCQHCRADVSAVVQAAVHAYDRIEIPEIRPDVTRVTLHGGVCPCCTRRFKAEPPADLEPGSPFGPNLRAFALYLRFTQAISFERLAKLVSDLLGLHISEGALNNMLEDSREAFARQYCLIRERLLSGTILQSDETSMRVGKRTWWNWVFHHDDSACFVIRPSRGRAVVEEFLGDIRPDFWVSDRLAAQMGWALGEQQVCLAHLLRDTQYAIDAGDSAFAPGVARLLKQAVAIGRRRDRLTDATLRAYAYKLEAKVDALLQITPANGQGEKLQRAIKKFRGHLFVFVTNRALPATNNGSEQALRPCVIFRKVTNCFRSQWGAELYANVRSVIETARRRAIGALDAIRLTLDGTPLSASAA